MSTETTTADKKAVETRSTAKALVEAIGVNGLFASFIIHYFLAIVVLNEVTADTFAEAPEWFLIAANSALAIPIITAMVMMGGYFLNVATDKTLGWRLLLIQGGAGATVGAPVLMWALNAGGV